MADPGEEPAQLSSNIQNEHSTQQASHVRQEPPIQQSDSSDSDVENIQQSHRNIGGTSGERDPLLAKKKKKTKGRNRLLHPEDYETIENAPPEDDEYLDAEFYANNGRFRVHKNYIVFLSNWKAILNVVLLVNTLLLVIMFVSEFFVEILPTSRLANFNDFILILISLIGNCFNLWFNKIGLFSPFDLHLNVALTILPLLNLLIIFIVKYTRERINIISIVIHLWTSLTFSLGIFQAYNLRRYIRNLSPPTAQNKHTMTEWIEIAFRNIVKFISLILLLLLLFTTFLHSIDLSNALRNVGKDESMFVWTGQTHSKKLHITCHGLDFNSSSVSDSLSHQPIVLYEHGGEDTSYTSGTWIEELYNLGKIERYCVYDRFGFGLSDSVSAPASLKKSAEALRFALVEELQLKDKFLVVGYDYGALIARVFAANNRDICSGLMLVEGWNEELLLKHYLRRIFPGDGDDQDPRNPDTGSNKGDRIDYRVPEKEIGKRYTIQTWLYGIWSAFGLNLHTSWFVSHHGSMSRIFGSDMVEEGGFIRNKVLESLSSSLISYNDILASNLKLQDIKLSIVSSKQFIKISPIWGNWQRQLTKLSKKTVEWRIIEGTHQFFKNGNGVEQAQDVLLRLINE